MAVVIPLASDVQPSLYCTHRIRQYARRYPPSYCSTRIFPLDPYTFWYFLDVSSMASHGLLGESTSLITDHWAHTDDHHTTGFLAHPHENPPLCPWVCFPLSSSAHCLSSKLH